MKKIFLFPTISEIPPKLKPSSVKSSHLYPFKNLPGCGFICTGPGKDQIVEVLKHFKKQKPELFIIIGYGGAISKKLSSGDIILCNSIFSKNQKKIHMNSQFFSSIKVHLEKYGNKVFIGPCFSSKKVVSEEEEKLTISKEGAIVIDMENYWAVKYAKQNNIPILAIRVILDTRDYKLPDLSGTLRKDGQISILLTIKYLLKNPLQLPVLLKIFSLTQKALPKIEQCIKSLYNF